MIGFDGFTDEIFSPVETRFSKEAFKPFSKMTAFAKTIEKAAGKSCNIELFLKQTKMGGNAVILTQGLIEAGHEIHLAATIGERTVEPLFTPLIKNVKDLYLLGASGHSEALEFEDGKIILGRHQSILNLSLEKVLERIGKKNFFDLLNRCDLFVSGNWTMLLMTNQLWQYIATNWISQFKKKHRWMFVDLADPAKRPRKDLQEALKLLKKLQKSFDVVLGLNISEAEQVAALLSIPFPTKTQKDILQLTKHLVQHLKISQVILHRPNFLAVSSQEASASTPTFLTKTPLLKTGAGDNFNAGYCNGLLLGLDLKKSLLLGAATAGYYVRHGKSPNIENLAFFLRKWDNNSHETFTKLS